MYDDNGLGCVEDAALDFPFLIVRCEEILIEMDDRVAGLGTEFIQNPAHVFGLKSLEQFDQAAKAEFFGVYSATAYAGQPEALLKESAQEWIGWWDACGCVFQLKRFVGVGGPVRRKDRRPWSVHRYRQNHLRANHG